MSRGVELDDDRVPPIVLDVAHPAHVHFMVAVATALDERGHRSLLVGRPKDVTVALLRASGRQHLVLPRAGLARRSHAAELTVRVAALRDVLRRTGAPAVLTRNPSGAIAARTLGRPSVFDTDDGPAVGWHYRLGAWAADTITTYRDDPHRHGPKERRYAGFKALTYLHPNRFRPDPQVRARVGLPPGPLFVARFSAHDASHDRKVVGLPGPARARLVHLLAEHGTVVVSSENEDPVVVPGRSVPPERFLDVLADADLCIGDSQSVAAEAAVLGVPSIRLSSFTGRAAYLSVLEHEYGLVRNFSPGDEELLLAAVRAHLGELDARREAARTARSRLLDDASDVAAWHAAELDRLTEAEPDRPKLRT